jgi:lipopolysaccharide export system permease protein
MAFSLFPRYRAKIAGLYIFREMLPTFILGNVIFVFILLMFQVLRLSSLMIERGLPFAIFLKMMTYLTVSFVPICFPISLLFSILLSFGRLSSDSEIVAFKASGLHLGHMLLPAMILSTLVGALTAYSVFVGSPWGNRSFEVLIQRLMNTKAVAAIQEGSFAEGFYVLYAYKVDHEQNLLKKVFIYDERDSQNPITILAQEGKLLEGDPKLPGHGVTLRLANGSIHRSNQINYTKVEFRTYDITLVNMLSDSTTEKSPPSLTYDDLAGERSHPSSDSAKHLMYLVEYHKRWAISAACLVFGLLGVGAGTVTNRRAVRASGLIISLGIMVVYWVLYLSGESLARGGALPPWIAMWAPNFLFTALGAWSIKRAW